MGDRVVERRVPPDRGLDTSPFRVLVVCTANLCRTPIVEHVMRRSSVLTGAGWAVVSAGVMTGGGRPMHPLAAKALGEQGVDTSGWVTRSLTPALVEAADLVLAVDRQTRREIVTLSPGSLNRTFVLGQFARLATMVPPIPAGMPRGRGESLLAAARQVRPQVGGLHDDDLADPVGHGIRRFRTAVQTVEAAVAALETPYRP